VDALAAPRRALGRIAETPVSLAIAAVGVAFLAWVEAHGSSTDRGTLVRFGALERGRVWDGEPWRLLTGAFLHVGWIHLAWNTVFGVPACRLVERALGSRRLLLLYLASALGASALSLLGQDRIAAGASGPLFGVVGAILALHRRGLPSWRAFVRSGATLWLAGGVAALTAVAPLLGVHVDHLAHLGGLATGAAAGWLFSSPRDRRVLPWLAFGAALGALVIAAAWPRAGASRFEGEQLERALDEALRGGDALAARRALARADARGWRSDAVGYYRSLLLVREGDLEGALDAARPLLRSADPAVAREAARTVVGVAKTLAYRHYTGDGAVRNPWRALAFMEEACGLGDEESCRNARRVRGR
jgi:membrane associated rhomboid family serine protease